MHALEMYVAFQKPKSLRAAFSNPAGALGHVEAFGYTGDQTWFFINPNRHGTDLIITHHHDKVGAEIERVVGLSYLVLRVPERRQLRFPLWIPMNCVSQISHLFGIRAFTRKGLERKLRALNAQEVHDGTPQGRPG